jgi:ABC-type nitrate/sulfonate/bicarbonate transport system permease component
MINAEQLFKTEIVVSGMVIVALVAALISMTGLKIERFATKWRRQ